MELYEITNAQQQQQHQPDEQSDELGFHEEQSAITDQLQALSVQPQEDEGDCSEIKEDDIKCIDDDDAQESLRSDGESANEGEGRNVEVRFGEKVERKETNKLNQFPIRQEAEDCSFYGRTGTCKFGMNCKFNHPPKRKPLSVKAKQKAKDDSSEKTAKVDCRYYDRPGGCKYGKACKYSHINKPIELNFLGLPIRPGEKACPYYLRNSSCKYGSGCRFNHPDPSASERSDILPVYNNGGPVALQGGPPSPLAPPWSPPPPMNDVASYMPLFFPPAQGIPSSPEWSNYQAPFYSYESNMPISPVYTINSPMLEANFYTQQQQMPVDEFPNRPGQPHCSYFLRTGDCKFKSACKFHHPKSKVSESPACTLSDLGLPLRPGQSICSNYSRYGICKFGPACKNDHPEYYAHTVALVPGQSPSIGTSINPEDAISVGT